VDYFTINVSCPNTSHAAAQRSLEHLGKLMAGIHRESEACCLKSLRRPLLIKLSPDWDNESILTLQKMAKEHGFDGIVAVNTTTDHELVAGHRYAREKGGLSGRPLYRRMRDVVELLLQSSDPLPLIASGGIENKNQINELTEKGVDLIQIYTSFVYKGPKLISDLL
jgi:dihydroorotate dehydrogenase